MIGIEPIDVDLEIESSTLTDTDKHTQAKKKPYSGAKLTLDRPSPTNKMRQVVGLYTHLGSMKRFSFGIRVLKEFWDNENQCILPGGTIDVEETNQFLHEQIGRMNAIIDKYYAQHGIKIHKDDLRAAFYASDVPEAEDTVSIGIETQAALFSNVKISHTYDGFDLHPENRAVHNATVLALQGIFKDSKSLQVPIMVFKDPRYSSDTLFVVEGQSRFYAKKRAGEPFLYIDVSSYISILQLRGIVNHLNTGVRPSTQREVRQQMEVENPFLLYLKEYLSDKKIATKHVLNGKLVADKLERAENRVTIAWVEGGLRMLDVGRARYQVGKELSEEQKRLISTFVDITIATYRALRGYRCLRITDLRDFLGKIVRARPEVNAEWVEAWHEKLKSTFAWRIDYDNKDEIYDEIIDGCFHNQIVKLETYENDISEI